MRAVAGCAVLALALGCGRVGYTPDLLLSIEDAPSGLGQPVGALERRIGQELWLFAVQRTGDGEFVRDVDVTWSLEGAIGTLSSTRDAATLLTFTAAGAGQVVANGGAARTSRISVSPCASDAECVDDCHASPSCDAGACVIGPTADVDGDGFIHVSCGGVDCDDDPDGCGAACAPGLAEMCDGFDNDCSLETEDGSGDPGLGGACDGEDLDLCADGEAICQDGFPVCAGDAGDGSEGPMGDASCTDGIDNDCDGSIDDIDVDCSNAATPPIADLKVLPGAVAPGATVTLDASGSTDREGGELEFRWDVDGDGSFDTAFGPADSFGAVYELLGTYTAVVEVRDPGGLSGFAVGTVFVTDASDILQVTTAIDENDPGASSDNPGGTGLSLREAITISNGTVGRQAITFSGPMEIRPVTGLPPAADVAGTAIVGRPGVVISGADLLQDVRCLELQAVLNVLLYVEIVDCPGPALENVGQGSLIAHSSFVCDGVDCVILGGLDTTFGPGNFVTCQAAAGVAVESRVNVVGNRISAFKAVHFGNSGQASAGSTIIGNHITGGFLNAVVTLDGDDHVIWHNLIALSSAGNVLTIPPASRGIDLRNNVFRLGNHAISARDENFGFLSNNAFDGQISGICNGCSGGTNNVIDPPQFVDPQNDDFRLLPTSPLVDAGAVVGVDVNGPAAGDFSGAAPDIGHYELP